MKLELLKTYGVLKTDNTSIIFKFVGGEPPCGIVKGECVPLFTILLGDVIAYWIIED